MRQLAVTSCLLLFTACHDSPSAPAETKPFQARVNSQLFVADITDFSTSHAGSSLLISGVRTSVSGGGRQVSVQVNNWAGPGTYPLAEPASGAFGFIIDFDASPQVSGSWLTTSQATGTLTVMSFDQTARQVRGTFSFEARDSTGNVQTVTQGSFTGNYLIDP